MLCSVIAAEQNTKIVALGFRSDWTMLTPEQWYEMGRFIENDLTGFVTMTWAVRTLSAVSVLYAFLALLFFPKWTIDDAYISYRYAEESCPVRCPNMEY